MILPGHKPECSGGESCSCGSEAKMAARKSFQLKDLLTRASLTQMEVEEYD